MIATVVSGEVVGKVILKVSKLAAHNSQFSTFPHNLIQRRDTCRISNGEQENTANLERIKVLPF